MAAPKTKALLSNPRFIAIVGMLGSNGPGEASNAAAMATKMLKESGLTWGELLGGLGGSGGGRDRVMEATLQSLQRQIANLQRAQEGMLTENKQLRKDLVKMREGIRGKDDMIKSLEAALKKANEQRRKAEEKPKQTGFRFDDVPPWDEDPNSKAAGGTTSASFAPRSYREILPWLTRLQKEGWDDLNDWEENFFTDFIERKKGILTERQYAIFQRTAVKTGLPLDF